MTLVALILAVLTLAVNWVGYMAFRHLAARTTAAERRLARVEQRLADQADFLAARTKEHDRELSLIWSQVERLDGFTLPFQVSASGKRPPVDHCRDKED